MNTSAQYMDDDVPSILASDNEPILLSLGGDGSFKKLKTIPAFSVHFTISLSISLTGIALYFTYPEKEKHQMVYFILVCLRAAFWIISTLFETLIRKCHNNLRMNGYHDFYRTICKYNGSTLIIVSAFNSMILLFAETARYGSASTMDSILILIAFNILETLFFTISHGLYIVNVARFNKNANNPDAMRGVSSATGALGLMQPGGNMSELLEKQADLIAYLKDHNKKLNEKLYQLTNSRTATLGH